MSDPDGPAAGPIAHGLSLAQRLTQLEARAGQTRDAVERRGFPTEDQQRSVLSTTIIYIFVGVVAFGMAILVLRGFKTNEWGEVTTQAIDLIKSAVLPVVTLVLGYYFGRSGRD